MSDRETQIAERLAATRWAHWQATAIAVDASARRYFRLTSADGHSAILMDAPPDSGERTAPFAAITASLRDMHLSAPEILLHDPVLGLMILEDLGPGDFARYTATHPEQAPALYSAATSVLIHLSRQIPPPDLTRMDPATGGEMVGVTAEWYGDPVTGGDLAAAVTGHLHRLAPRPDTIALRDFHAENLIWRPDRTGLDRVGLLDYQDAFLAPAGYDLASLLRDARRDVDDALAETLIKDYAKATARDLATFRAAFAMLSVQRNLRILGIFARLILRDHKLKYRAFIPRVWRHIQTDLAHPALHDLRDLIAVVLPPPDQSTLKEWL